MTVLLALVMTVLIGFLGLAVDVGHLFLVKTQLQNAADATALAAVGDSNNATGKALTILTMNSADGAPLAAGDAEELGYSYATSDVPGKPTYVCDVTLGRTVHASFIRVLSPITSVRVKARARAESAPDAVTTQYTNIKLVK